MDFITNLTQKDQLSVGKQQRLKAGFHPKQRVRVRAEKGRITIEAVEDLLSLAGKFKPRKNKQIDAVEARAYMEDHYERI